MHAEFYHFIYHYDTYLFLSFKKQLLKSTQINMWIHTYLIMAAKYSITWSYHDLFN